MTNPLFDAVCTNRDVPALLEAVFFLTMGHANGWGSSNCVWKNLESSRCLFHQFAKSPIFECVPARAIATFFFPCPACELCEAATIQWCGRTARRLLFLGENAAAEPGLVIYLPLRLCRSPPRARPSGRTM